MNNQFLQNIWDLDEKATGRFAWLYYGLVHAIRPKIIVETGIYKGFTTAFLAAAAKEVGACVIAIDNFLEGTSSGQVTENLRRCGVLEPVTIVQGDALDTLRHLSSQGQLRELGMAVLDDIHSYDQVSAELRILWPLLVDGGIIGGHDSLCEIFNGVHNAYLDHELKARCGGLWLRGSNGCTFLQKLERPLSLYPPNWGEVDTRAFHTQTTDIAHNPVSADTVMPIQIVLKKLPHRIGEGSDWFESPTCYPLHARILQLLSPQKYVEFGTYVGYSLIAALTGAASIQQVAWADNQSYIADSNRIAQANLNAYLQTTDRKLEYTYCQGVDELGSYPPGSAQLRPFHKPDVLYVDGDHTFDGALRDLRLARDLQAKVILIDDFTNISEVRHAAEHFAREENVTLYRVPTFRGLGIIDMQQATRGEEAGVFTLLQQGGISITSG